MRYKNTVYWCLVVAGWSVGLILILAIGFSARAIHTGSRFSTPARANGKLPLNFLKRAAIMGASGIGSSARCATSAKGSFTVTVGILSAVPARI